MTLDRLRFLHSDTKVLKMVALGWLFWRMFKSDGERFEISAEQKTIYFLVLVYYYKCLFLIIIMFDYYDYSRFHNIIDYFLNLNSGAEKSLAKAYARISLQGCNHGKNLLATVPMVGRICPSGLNRVKVSENLGSCPYEYIPGLSKGGLSASLVFAIKLFHHKVN